MISDSKHRTLGEFKPEPGLLLDTDPISEKKEKKKLVTVEKPLPRSLETSGLNSLPRIFSAESWRQMQAAFEWNERRKVWNYHPEWLGEKEVASEDRESPIQPGPKDMSLDRFIGQRKTIESLSISIRAATIRGELPPPVLLSGPPGLGKTIWERKMMG